MAGQPSEGKRNEDYFIEKIAYRKSGRQRFTQDSPILADVIVRYGTSKDKELDLLLTPDWSKTPEQVAEELSAWLGVSPGDDEAPEDTTYRVAYNKSVVVVKLTFEELVCNVLPLSWWWQNQLMTPLGLEPVAGFTGPSRDRVLAELLAALQVEFGKENWRERERGHWLIRQDLAWATRMFHVVQHSNVSNDDKEPSDENEIGIRAYFLKLIDRISKRQEELDRSPPSEPWIYSVNRNREIDESIFDSVETSKADAARRTFDIGGENICWGYRRYRCGREAHRVPEDRAQRATVQGSLRSGWSEQHPHQEDLRLLGYPEPAVGPTAAPPPAVEAAG